MTIHLPRLAIRPSRLAIYLVLVLFAAFYLLPIYLLLVTGLKSFAEVSLSRMWNLPSGFRFDSFIEAFRGAEGHRGLDANFLNSVTLVVPASLISALVGSLNGYVLSKWKFRGSDVLFFVLLFGMFIPYQSVLIPLVKTLQWMEPLGAVPILGSFLPGYNTISGLILIHVVYGIPITTLIFRNFYAGIPTELVDAAKIDGASFFGIYRRVLVPLSLPAFAVVLIWQFTSIWNEFLFAVIVTSDPARQPVTVALYNLAGSYIVEWNVQMAGALLVALPTLIVYTFLGRLFLRGLMAGALRG